MKAYFFPNVGYIAAQVTDEGEIDFNILTQDFEEIDGGLIVDMELDEAIDSLISEMGWKSLKHEEVDYQETVDRFLELEMENVRQRTRNVKNPPVEAKWFDDVEYDGFLDASVTYKVLGCPTCGDFPLYGRDMCPYCGQRLIIPDIPKTEPSEYVGCREENGLICDCGSRNLILKGHADGRDFYGPLYECADCGKMCSVHIDRRGTHWMF